MGTVVIAGTSLSDGTAIWAAGVATAIAGNYYAVDTLGEEPSFTPVISDRREIKFPGVDWSAEKDFGKVKAYLYIDVIVFATLANLRSEVKALHASFATNTRYTITINGTDFQGCKLDIPATGRSKRLNFGGGIVGERIPYVFKQLSDTN